MLERLETALKLACLALAALLLVQVSRLALTKSPLANLTIPELPALPAASDSAPQGGKNPDASAAKGAEKKGTNAPEKEAKGSGTNSHSAAGTAKAGTNSGTAQPAGKTNSVPTPRVELESAGSNSVAAKSTGTNKSNSISVTQTNQSGTNLATGASSGKSNTLAGASVGKHGSSTNAPPPVGDLAKAGGMPPEMAMMRMHSPGGPGAGPGAATLAPPVKARVNRITESELLAPVMHPMPAGLLGIAGNVAFLRSDNGQTGMVKEGDDLGGMKLLRIGVNRVLVEQDGEKKELMIFEGYGGESLMPRKQEKSP